MGRRRRPKRASRASTYCPFPRLVDTHRSHSAEVHKVPTSRCCSSRRSRRAGVAVIVLNRARTQSPEDERLLPVQGVVAEYERAQLLERSRRGRRHAAQAGSVSVLGTRLTALALWDGRGRRAARQEIVPEAARVVRQSVAWVGRGADLRAVCRRLRQAGARTRQGKTVWDRATVWGRRSIAPPSARPASAGRGALLGTRGCGRNAATRGHRAARSPRSPSRRRRGSAYPSPRWSTRPSSPPHRSNWPTIGSGRGSPARGAPAAAGPGGLRPVRRRLLRHQHTAARRGWGHARIRVVPLSRPRSLSLRRRATLRQHPGVAAGAGGGGLAAGARAAGEHRPPGTGVSAAPGRRRAGAGGRGAGALGRPPRAAAPGAGPTERPLH